MKNRTLVVGTLVLTVSLLATVASVQAAPVPRKAKEIVIKDRKKFIPNRQYQSLPGKVVGLMVSDVRAKMAHEGRSGPPDAMGFSRDAGSYRWVYVPTDDARPLISGLRVRIGEKGDRTKTYPRLDMARPSTVKQFSLDVPFALVEVEVNDGEGAPAQEGFVATKMQRLDGSERYPLNVAEIVTLYRKKHEQYLKSEKAGFDKELNKARIAAIKGQKATGPREQRTVTYLTWLADKEQLCIRFHTTITDGAYKFTEGGGPIRPFPLPVPRPIRKDPRQIKLPPAQIAPGAFPPPPPPRERIRYGATFGIELGRGYVISKSGALVNVEKLPVASFTALLPPPPNVGGPPRPVDPLPPRRK